MHAHVFVHVCYATVTASKLMSRHSRIRVELIFPDIRDCRQVSKCSYARDSFVATRLSLFPIYLSLSFSRSCFHHSLPIWTRRRKVRRKSWDRSPPPLFSGRIGGYGRERNFTRHSSRDSMFLRVLIFLEPVRERMTGGEEVGAIKMPRESGRLLVADADARRRERIN